MNKTRDDVVSDRPRVLARTLATEELAAATAGSGQTSVVTQGSVYRDITNLDSDNDGPSV